MISSMEEKKKNRQIVRDTHLNNLFIVINVHERHHMIPQESNI